MAFSTPRLAALAAIVVFSGLVGGDAAGDGNEPICLAVMDPLAARLSCPCVAGYAQRDYEALASHLEQKLGRPVKTGFGESLRRATETADCPVPHIIIGKHSVVKADARAAGLNIEPMLALSDLQGQTVQRGLFVVATDDPAESIEDLVDHELHLGEEKHSEKHAMPLKALRLAGVLEPAAVHEHPSCSDAAATVLEVKPPTLAAAVVSSYAQPLLEGCGAVPKGALRVVGQTGPVRFITAFVTAELDFQTREAVRSALLAVAADKPLCAKLESSAGFVALPETVPSAWTGWRGPRRSAIATSLPDRLPDLPERVWSRSLARPGLGGIAATANVVIYGDRDDEDRQDVFQGLDAVTGKPRWTIAYDAVGSLDYGNSPRATPLIEHERVYLLGAFGHLHCVDLISGKILWQRNLAADYQVPRERRSVWGYCSSPLVVDRRLIVAPGAEDASVVALDPATGRELWRSPGAPAGHGSFVAATVAGKSQVIGHDNATLGGWDVASGRRLWTLKPPVVGDFNVPTPVLVGDKLLITTEMNGTRLHAFQADGTISAEPLARSDDLAPDMATPVSVGTRIFGIQECVIELDAARGLATVQRGETGGLDTYAAVIAGHDRLLAIGNKGRLMMYDISGAGCRLASECDAFAEMQGAACNPVYSHPAIVGTRLFIRGEHEITCLELSPPTE
jgi:ABC-type phosphate/phosphonate transport system substrate-binding protein